MGKIIIVGELDRTAEELYKCLNEKYEVMFCTETGDVMQNMLRIVKPDLVFVNAEVKESVSMETISLFHKFYPKLPVLILGKKEVCDVFKEAYNGMIAPLYRPVSTGGILEKCAGILPEENEEKEAEEKSEVIKKTILIVDDSAITLRSVKSLLDSRYHIMVAPSGEMALKLMEKNVPDMILLDYEMPEWDGRQTLEKIREDEKLKEIPVIFLTGVTDKTRISSILKLNPAGYLLKPTEKDKLLSAIERVFEKQMR